MRWTILFALVLVSRSAIADEPQTAPLPTAPPPNGPAVPVETPTPSIFFFELGVGGKAIASDSELRANIGIGIQVPKFPLGGALEAHLGTGGSFSDGHWFRGMFALPIRYALGIGSSMAIEIGAGPALSILSIGATNYDVVSTDPVFRTTLAFELRAASFAIAAVAAADIQEHKIYKANNATLEVSPAGISFILRVRVGIF